MKTKIYIKPCSLKSMHLAMFYFITVIFIISKGDSLAQNLLINGSFELPALSQNSHVTIAGPATIPGWVSVEPPTNSYEIWNGDGGGEFGPGASDGNQYLELNSQACGHIYQDFNTCSIYQIAWAFKHRKRIQNTDNNTVEILIGPANGTLVSQGIFTDDGNNWYAHNNTYNVPSGQCITRFEIKCLSPGGSIGNFIDDISVIPTSFKCCSIYGSADACNNDDITSLTFSGVNTITNPLYSAGNPCSPGYTNLSNDPAYSPAIYSFIPGCNYAFSAGIGLTSGSTNLEGVKVWIDYNDNCIYEATELVFASTGFTSGLSGNNSIGANITIPISAPVGQHCMRVRSVRNSNSFTPESIESFGETEDYVITIFDNANLGPDQFVCDGDCIDLSTPFYPGNTYSWFSLPGMTLLGNSHTLHLCSASSGCYKVIATNTAGCTYTDEICITIVPKPAQVTVVNSVQCGYGVPSASVIGNGGIFHWYRELTGGTFIDGETGSTLHSTAINLTTTFYVSELANSCESERVAVIATVVLPDAVTAMVSAETICSGQSVDLSFIKSGNMNNYSVAWTTDEYINSGLSGPTAGSPLTITPAAAGTYTYMLTATDAVLNCVAISYISVVVLPSPIIDSLIAMPDIICAGTMVTLNVYSADLINGTGPQNFLLWYNWTPDNFSDFTVNDFPLTTTTYTVQVTDPNTNCSSTDSIIVTVLPFPGAPLATNSTQCGDGVPLCSVTGSGNTFNWYLLPTAVTAIPSENGNSLTTTSISTTTNFYVSESNGYCESPRTLVTATVTPPPPLTLTASRNICTNEVENLYVTSFTGDFDSYEWFPLDDLYQNPAGDIPYTLENLSSVYVKLNANGSHLYSCIATNTTTGCVNIAYITITDTTDDGNACTNDFCDPLTGAVTHTLVNIDDNNPCTVDACNSSNGNISHVNILNCNPSPRCCPDFILRDAVKICQRPCDTAGTIPCNEFAACKKTPHKYTVYPDLAGFTYSWTVVGGTPVNFTGNPLNVTWDQGTTGFIRVIITGTANYTGCGDTITRKVTLIDGPDADFTFTPGSPVCKNSLIKFTNASIGGSIFYWDFGDGTTDNHANPPAHQYKTPGTYLVHFSVTDQGNKMPADSIKIPCGCTDTITKQIVVLADSVAEIISECCTGCKTGTVCPGDTSGFCTTFVCSTYNWSVTGGTIISGAGTNCIKVAWNNAPYPGPTTVSLATPGCTGCNGTNTLNVPVLYPDLPITGPNVLCVGSSGTYSLPSMPGTYYNWTVSPSGNYLFNTADQNVTTVNVSFNAAGTYTVQCIYNNPMTNCPQGTSTFIVEVKTIFAIDNVQPKVCEGSVINYSANGVATWSISPHGGNFLPVVASTTTLTWASFPGLYTITATPTTPSLYCNSSAAVVVEVIAKPVLGNINGQVLVCPGIHEYSVTSNKTGSPFTWILTTGTGSILSQFGPDQDSAIIFLSGIGPWKIGVYQTIEISPGVTCQSLTKTLDINTYGPPTVSEIGSTPSAIVCVDDIRDYLASGPSPPGGFLWTINPSTNGTIISGQGTNSVTIRWHGTPGIATITASHCGGSGSTSVTIFDPPIIAGITVNGAIKYCDPAMPSGLVLSVPSGYTYVWNGPPGAGVPPVGNTWSIPNSLWVLQHDYYFSVTVSNAHCSITKAIFIQLQICDGNGNCNAPPACSFDFTTNPVCVNDPASFFALPTNSALFYEWEFGDGATSFKSPTQHSYALPGIYTVTLKVEGCPLIKQHDITVNPKPSCVITVPDSAFCPGDSIYFTGCAGKSAYQWYKDGNAISGATSQNYYFHKRGEYWLQVWNIYNCTDTSNHIYIYQQTPPAAKIAIVGDSHFCVLPSSSFSFSLMSIQNLHPCSYIWSSNAGATFNPNYNILSFFTNVTLTMPATLPVSYQFYIKVIDLVTGCEASDTICITFYEQPVLNIQSIPVLDVCEGRDVTLTPDPDDAIKYNYQWNNGATSTVITVSAPGYYALTITDKSSGCFDTHAAGFIHPKPDLSLFPEGCDTFCHSDYPLYIPLPYSTFGYDNEFYYPLIKWYDNNNYSSSIGTGQNFMMSPSPGSHHISVVVQNGYGCMDTAGVLCLLKENCCDTPLVHVQCFGQIIPDCGSFLASGRLGITITGGKGGIAVTITKDGSLYLNTSLASERSYNFNYLGAGHYCVTVTDTNGCKDSCCTDLVCCRMTILTDCGNFGEITLCAKVMDYCCSNEKTYSWTGPNGFMANTECITANTAGTYSVTTTCISGGVYTASIEANPSRNGWAVATNYGVQGSSFDKIVKLIDVRGNFNSQPKNVNTIASMYSDPSWNTQNLSEVFGLAHDHAGNIFVAATTAYGPTTFTVLPPPAYSTGGNVYRLDANSNNVITLASLPNRFSLPITNFCGSIYTYIVPQAPGLGNLCYDKFHGQLLVSNFEDGKIYRVDALSGGILGIAFDPLAADDGTPGFAPLGQRIWGIGVTGTNESTVKVYYSIWANDEGRQNSYKNVIRSVDLNANGEFINSSDMLRIAVNFLDKNCMANCFSNPVSDIEFSEDGNKMLVAERTMLADIKYENVESPCWSHQSRVLEYVIDGNGDWQPSLNQFSISSYPVCNNGTSSTGGVDYGFDNIIGDSLPTFCDSTIVAMADAIHLPDSTSCGIITDYIYGLQKSHATGNNNIANSVLIDYDNDLGNAPKTFQGDVDVFKCCATQSRATLTLKVYIEGYYLGAGTMQPVLFNAAQYSGIQPVPSTDLCDTIFVVLHDVNAVGPYDYPIIASTFALLETNGHATVTFPASISGGEYWIAIRNRTMVETWSALPVTFAANTNYDFTPSASMAYFDNMRDLLDGNWAMYTGDIDDGTNTPFQDGVVDGSDFLAFDNQAQQSAQGYFISDLNGDGVVDGSDFLIFDVNAQLSIQRITPP